MHPLQHLEHIEEATTSLSAPSLERCFVPKAGETGLIVNPDVEKRTQVISGLIAEHLNTVYGAEAQPADRLAELLTAFRTESMTTRCGALVTKEDDGRVVVNITPTEKNQLLGSFGQRNVDTLVIKLLPGDNPSLTIELTDPQGAEIVGISVRAVGNTAHLAIGGSDIGGREAKTTQWEEGQEVQQHVNQLVHGVCGSILTALDQPHVSLWTLKAGGETPDKNKLGQKKLQRILDATKGGIYVTAPIQKPTESPEPAAAPETLTDEQKLNKIREQIDKLFHTETKDSIRSALDKHNPYFKANPVDASTATAMYLMGFEPTCPYDGTTEYILNQARQHASRLENTIDAMDRMLPAIKTMGTGTETAARLMAGNLRKDPVGLEAQLIAIERGEKSDEAILKMSDKPELTSDDIVEQIALCQKIRVVVCTMLESNA